MKSRGFESVNEIAVIAIVVNVEWDGFVHFEFGIFFCQYPSDFKGFRRGSQIHHIGLRSCFFV